ncbi:MAG: hypothetical protein H7321_06105 [Bacteroidia bacterium]|nr:hypothetical protein [Bacteroidia bacterium]
MKTLPILTILISVYGCNNNQIPNSINSLKAKITLNNDSAFRHLQDYPKIKDSTKFISDLIQTFKLEIDQVQDQNLNAKITAYNKVKLYGSDLDYFFIEYDYATGSGAAFPWKYQLIISTEGKLVKALSAFHFKFITIFKNENPFLMIVSASSKGNGGHEIYKIRGDTLENVYEGYYNCNLRTYDAHEDNMIYEPNELTLKIQDYNKDGFNDISFNGKIVFIQGRTNNGIWYDEETINGKLIKYSVDHPFKKFQVEYVFLYDRLSGHFKAKEIYTDKFGLND